MEDQYYRREYLHGALLDHRESGVMESDTTLHQTEQDAKRSRNERNFSMRSKIRPMPSTEGMKIRSDCSLGALPSLSILRHSLNHLVVDVVVAHAAAQLEPE